MLTTNVPANTETVEKLKVTLKSIKDTRENITYESYAKVDNLAYDTRHPLYVGGWERSIPGQETDISRDSLDEPHIKRKHVILAAHPEIAKLYGVEPLTKYVTLSLVVIQLSLAYYFGRVNDSNWQMLVVCYLVGACISQNFGIVIHEATHGLVCDSTLGNRMAGLLANVAIPVPIAMSFRRYHLEHHSYQGVIGRDPDLPLDWEVKFVRGHPLRKFVFLLFYPLMYVVRGAAQQKTPTKWEVANIVFTVACDALVVQTCGLRGLGYLFMCLWLGYGIHPAAAHFIQEHFSFVDGQETYSYYGSFNKLFMNIGYHNEHHDFTKVPWTKLPAVRDAAPEYYNTLHYHMSWWNVLYRFVFDKTIGPQSRVARDYDDHKKGRAMVANLKTLLTKID